MTGPGILYRLRLHRTRRKATPETRGQRGDSRRPHTGDGCATPPMRHGTRCVRSAAVPCGSRRNQETTATTEDSRTKRSHVTLSRRTDRHGRRAPEEDMEEQKTGLLPVEHGFGRLLQNTILVACFIGAPPPEKAPYILCSFFFTDDPKRRSASGTGWPASRSTF